LEIGGGDGFLAALVAEHCRSFVTTDSYRPRLADGDQANHQVQTGGTPAKTTGKPKRLVCDATRLPFVDGSFDFIFSSSLLEHVRDRPAAYREMHRCLRPGGLMLHIMPSRTWKLLQMLFYYPHLIVGGIDLVLDKLTGPRPPKPAPVADDKPTAATALVTDRWSDKRSWRASWKTIVEGIIPRPHGEYPGHAAEWKGFGADAWAREWEEAGFRVHRILLLPLYSGYGFGFEWLRRLGEKRGLSSHNAFVVSKPAETPSTLAFFEQPRPRLAAVGRIP